MSLIENYAQNHVDLLKHNDYIDPALYKKYGVKSGLRNEDGKGVLAGLTNISRIVSEKVIDGRKQPCDGELWYRGHRINDLIEDLGDNLGFEKIAYLLIMGVLPGDKELAEFTAFFAIARIVGWSAHRLEELITSNKIIRPAYKSVMKRL